MAIDFEVIDKGCRNFRKPYKIVSLPQKLSNFFVHDEIHFSIRVLKFLSSLNPYVDTKLSHEDLEIIQLLCENIHDMFTNIQDYSVYDILKQSEIKQKDLIDFSDSMQSLIAYALENDKEVWTVVD